MPGITDPTEEYFKDGLWAWDPADPAQWRKLIIDPLTNRLVIDHPGDLEVVQPVPADLCVANYGWVGLAWHKLPLLWGYSERWAEDLSGTQENGGTYSATTTPVDTGWVHVLQGVSIYNGAGDRGLTYIAITDPGVAEVRPVVQTTSVRYIPLTLLGTLVLAEGDTVTVVMAGCLDDDGLVAGAWGYKMKIAE